MHADVIWTTLAEDYTSFWDRPLKIYQSQYAIFYPRVEQERHWPCLKTNPGRKIGSYKGASIAAPKRPLELQTLKCVVDSNI